RARQGCRRSCDAGEIRFLGQYESRNPDADERDHRYVRSPDDQPARAQSARDGRDNRHERPASADDHQSNPRLLQNRIREARTRAGAVRSRRLHRGGAAAGGAKSGGYRRRTDLCARRRDAEAGRWRCRTVTAAARQPFGQRHQVHAVRRGRRDRLGSAARGLAAGGSLRGARHRDRHPKGSVRSSIQGFQPGGCLDHAPIRRGQAWGGAHPTELAHRRGGGTGRERERGKGSTFHFTMVADEVEALERAAADGEQPELAGKRVLIVDDNASNRLLLKLQTERWGMRARDTNSPAVALEWIVQGDPFDVALLDYQMPEMDGIALAREIRAVRGAHAPVLILLSSTGQSLASAHADAGFAARLSKPLRLSHLRDRLLEMIGDQRDTSAGAVP